MDQQQLQDKLLADPQVQAAIKKAGQDALNDPGVQAQIKKTAQEKFPEYASMAQQQLGTWARDPAVQAKAKAYAGVASQYAAQYMGQAGEQTIALVEQGPTGVRLLAFLAGVASCAN